ncbi:hypothetical protein ACFFLM_11935 [Deinococcus oregonensis]|uniref:Heme NO-binding domain-containing protein n=1 Tax=Deinococcus oregonensis TaxID=1805970 RepID=A0ABV6B2P8_9DEIO
MSQSFPISSEEKRIIDEVQVFYCLFDCIIDFIDDYYQGVAWNTLGMELIDCGPINTFACKGDSSIQHFLDLPAKNLSFTSEGIAHHLEDIESQIQHLKISLNLNDAEIDHRFGVSVFEDHFLHLTDQPNEKTISIGLFFALWNKLNEVIGKVKAEHFNFEELSLPIQTIQDQILADYTVMFTFKII